MNLNQWLKLSDQPERKPEYGLVGTDVEHRGRAVIIRFDSPDGRTVKLELGGKDAISLGSLIIEEGRLAEEEA